MDNNGQASPGTASYFPSLVNRIRDVHPDLPFDPVILQSILLCLVAGPVHGSNIGYTGRKNLVLRAREEDIGIVLNLSYLILTRVFGIVTTKHKVKKDSGSGSRSSGLATSEPSVHAHEFPDELIRNCFLRTSKPGARHVPSSGTIPKHHRDHSRKSGSLHGPRRSSTLPSASYSPTIVEPSLHSAPSKESDPQRNAPSLSSLRVRPKVPRMETEPASIQSRPRLEAAHSLAEPQSAASTAAPSPTVTVSGALVISGLEHSSLPSQRALLRVLHERKIVLDAEGEQSSNAWKLPSDFILIYVSPLNAYDRPPILRTLLDHFGMSADVNISPAFRQTYLTYQNATSPLSSSFQSLATPRSPLSPLWSPDSIQPPSSPRLRGSPLHLGGHQHSASLPATPVITPQELSYLRMLTTPVPPNLRQAGVIHNSEAYTSMHPTLNIYLQDLFAAARHHPMVDGSLLTLRAHHDAEDLVRAFRVICGNSLGSELISTVAAVSAANGDARHSEDTRSEDILSSPTEETSSLGWDKAEDEWLGAELQIGRQKASSVRSLEIRVNGQLAPGAHSVLFDGQSEGDGSRTNLLSALPRQPEVWDISEADIGKVFPRVVSHRLRMRTGRDDEVLGGVMFPAVQEVSEPDRVRGIEDKTVKQVIIGILADV